VVMDDCDGRILYARFVEQEGTMSTMAALHHVLRKYGRFCEFYSDRGSHFCRTEEAGQGPAEEQNGEVTRVLEVLGIRQILARSPQARGRSERAFKTIQGRLPQELKLTGVGSYPDANTYLETVFVPDFNRRFTVEPAQPENAFTKLVGVDLELLLSVQTDRKVDNNNIVHFNNLSLQLSPTDQRPHYVRCPVVVHELLDDNLAVSYQGKRIGRFDRQGQALLPSRATQTSSLGNHQKHKAVETAGLMDRQRRLPKPLGQPAIGLPPVTTPSAAGNLLALKQNQTNPLRTSLSAYE